MDSCLELQQGLVEGGFFLLAPGGGVNGAQMDDRLA
jgi:hypothetical protein